MREAVVTTNENRELREARKHLRDLTSMVARAIAAIDAEMKRPASNERGARIAQITNALELENDIAKRFGLSNRTAK